MLCGECEKRRGKWEAIVAAAIVGTGDGRIQRPELHPDDEYSRQMIRVEEIPYGPVKLWVLSTLYLMHHATKSDWAQFYLTADEESRLRKLLLSGEPGSDLEFQILGQMTFRSPATQGISGGIISPGFITEFRDGAPRTRMAHFFALDVHWIVVLGDWPANPLRAARLRADGKWRVLRDIDFRAFAQAAPDLGLIFSAV